MGMPSTGTRTRLFTVSQEHAPARSAALITAVMSEAPLLAGGRVLGADRLEAVSMAEVAAAPGDYMNLELIANSEMEKKIMLHAILIFFQPKRKKFVRISVS